MPEVTVYTSGRCSHCERAKGLLERRGVPYEEIRLGPWDIEERMRLIERTGRMTVPQIFIGSASIGGFEELHALDQSGRLAEMLAA